MSADDVFWRARVVVSILIVGVLIVGLDLSAHVAQAQTVALSAPPIGWNRATITRVIDGDTFDATIDLGYRLKLYSRIRLYGVNAPEVRGPEKPKGLESKSYVESWFASCPQIEVKSHGRGHFGRELDDVDCTTTGHSLATDELVAGMAVPYK